MKITDEARFENLNSTSFLIPVPETLENTLNTYCLISYYKSLTKINENRISFAYCASYHHLMSFRPTSSWQCCVLTRFDKLHLLFLSREGSSRESALTTTINFVVRRDCDTLVMGGRVEVGFRTKDQSPPPDVNNQSGDD